MSSTSPSNALWSTWTSYCSLDEDMSEISVIGVQQNSSYTWDKAMEASLPSCPPTSIMPATASTSILSRCVAWFLGKPSRPSSDELVEESEEACIPAPPTLKDASYPYISSTSAALSASPLALLEISLLCTAQGVVAIPEEPQTTVLRTAVTTTKVTVVKSIQPTPMEVEITAPTPTICLTPPTPQKRKSKADSRPFAPLQNAPGTLRPSGRWHGRKHRRVHDKENVAPAVPLKTREERLKAYTPPARLLGLRHSQEVSFRYPTSRRF